MEDYFEDAPDYMKHVSVSKPPDRYVYLVKGVKLKGDTWVKHKFLWDACGENNIKRFYPRD